MDANWLVAGAAVTTLFIQVLVGAYFYGGLSQSVKNIREEAKQWRESVRTDFAELKGDVKDLRKQLYYRGYVKRDT